MYCVEVHHVQVDVHIDSCLLKKGITSNTIMHRNKQYVNFWTVAYVQPNNVGIFSTPEPDTLVPELHLRYGK